MKDEDKNKETLIAELKALRQKIGASEQKYIEIMAYMTEGIYLIRVDDGIIVYTNPAFEKVFGYDHDELLGKHVSIMDVPKGQNVEKNFTDIIPLLNHTDTWKGEIQNIKKDGTIIWCYAYVSAFDHPEHGRVLATMQIDITERRMLEAQLRHTQKMEAISVLAGGIAHEFNNLLTPMMGYAEMLMENKTPQDPDQKYLKPIFLAGNRASRLIRQMQMYGQKSTMNKISLSMDRLVDDTINLLLTTIPPNISIKKDIEPDLYQVHGIADEIHQVLLNLCINASQAMPDGGELTICLKNTEYLSLSDSQEQLHEGHFIVMSVKDEGSGMDPMTKEKIFDPFFTTREVGKGTGLGLSVVWGIVEQHQGHIVVESEQGKGSTFHVYLPAVTDRLSVFSDQVDHMFSGTERILLIDDEQMVTNMTSSMLEEYGYTVKDFLDSKNALAWFTENPYEIDLIITDYGMPEMNGKQFIQKIKEIRPELPAILMTGYNEFGANEDIQSWGLEEMVHKPIKLQDFRVVVRAVLDKRVRLNG
ncbi:MAG: PAS domain S-box protein [SAR324 cluster bacterium]|nr:PAS domain S-box protein [SAR324 cluster bacterium]